MTNDDREDFDVSVTLTLHQEHGHRIEVREDHDGFGTMEIAQYDDMGKEIANVQVLREHVDALREIIGTWVATAEALEGWRAVERAVKK